MSTAYYALFHAFSKDCADLIVGPKPAAPGRAWAQAYRALDHGFAKNACGGVGNLGFPNSLCVCARAFIDLQQQRHDADYDPEYDATRAKALAAIKRAKTAIDGLEQSSKRDRRAFVVQLLMKKRL